MTRRFVASLAAVATLAALTAPTQEARANEIRLEFQGRMDVFNTFGVDGVTFPIGSSLGDNTLTLAMVPLVTTGVRLLENGALFVGIGAGYASATLHNCVPVINNVGGCDTGETSTTLTSWSLSPMVSYEFLSTEYAGLYAAVWVNLGGFGGSSVTTTDAQQNTTTVDIDQNFWWGVNIGLGIRGKITKAIALGTEWGWGIAGGGAAAANNEEDTALFHGIWGTLTLQASIGL